MGRVRKPSRYAMSSDRQKEADHELHETCTLETYEDLRESGGCDLANAQLILNAILAGKIRNVRFSYGGRAPL